MPRTFTVIFLLHPLLILLLLPPPPTPRALLFYHFYFFGPLIEIRKQLSFGISPEPVFKFSDSIDGHFELLFFENKALFLFIDDLNSLFYLIIEVKDKSF